MSRPPSNASAATVARRLTRAGNLSVPPSTGHPATFRQNGNSLPHPADRRQAGIRLSLSMGASANRAAHPKSSIVRRQGVLALSARRMDRPVERARSPAFHAGRGHPTYGRWKVALVLRLDGAREAEGTVPSNPEKDPGQYLCVPRF